MNKVIKINSTQKFKDFIKLKKNFGREKDGWLEQMAAETGMTETGNCIV